MPQVWGERASIGNPRPVQRSAAKNARSSARGFGLAHAADDFGAMMAGSGFEHPRAVLHAAAFRVVGAEDQPADRGTG